MYEVGKIENFPGRSTYNFPSTQQFSVSIDFFSVCNWRESIAGRIEILNMAVYRDFIVFVPSGWFLAFQTQRQVTSSLGIYKRRWNWLISPGRTVQPARTTLPTISNRWPVRDHDVWRLPSTLAPPPEMWVFILLYLSIFSHFQLFK